MIFLENIWIWLAIAVMAVATGWSFCQGLGSVKPLLIGAGSAVVTLGLGIFLVYGIQTDRQRVIQTVNALARAIAANDLDKVCSFVEPQARETLAKAKYHMGLVKIEWTKVRDLKVPKINYYTSPPSVIISFRGTVGGRVLSFDAPFTVQVVFTEVLFRQGSDGKWYVTDECRFVYPGYDGQKIH